MRDGQNGGWLRSHVEAPTRETFVCFGDEPSRTSSGLSHFDSFEEACTSFYSSARLRTILHCFAQGQMFASCYLAPFPVPHIFARLRTAGVSRVEAEAARPEPDPDDSVLSPICVTLVVLLTICQSCFKGFVSCMHTFPKTTLDVLWFNA